MKTSRGSHRTPVGPRHTTEAAAAEAPAEVPAPGPRPGDGLRRLVPQALVVAVLAGGAGALVVDHKAIRLSVDGVPRTLHTFTDDVGELLAAEGIAVGAHDLVVPAPGTAQLAWWSGMRPAHPGPPPGVEADEPDAVWPAATLA
ncbi:ubiquitin-like domain-containing protein, partial [Streptomyces sp. Act-28]